MDSCKFTNYCFSVCKRVVIESYFLLEKATHLFTDMCRAFLNNFVNSGYTYVVQCHLIDGVSPFLSLSHTHTCTYACMHAHTHTHTHTHTMLGVGTSSKNCGLNQCSDCPGNDSLLSLSDI